MPIKRKQGETKEEFIPRCIAIEINAGKPNDQAAAICYDAWDEKQLKAVKNIRRKKIRKFSDVNFEKQRVFVDSSNVDRIMWNSDNLELTIKFNDGEIYTYFDVSEEIFTDVSTGNAAPITTGENEYGSWTEGVKPSVGAAVHQYLIEKNVRFERGGSFR